MTNQIVVSHIKGENSMWNLGLVICNHLINILRKSFQFGSYSGLKVFS